MLTRLEVQGFKNMVDMKIDFGAFTCLAGENGTGKSNVFDAVHILSLLADRSLLEAAQEVRGVHGERTGVPCEFLEPCRDRNAGDSGCCW